MLSISLMKGTGQGDYYLELAREDYYLAGGEPRGLWTGQAAQALGLSGFVERDDLKKLLGGFAPRSGDPLVQNAGAKDRQSGWDLCFSAPKSVSFLWAISPPEVRLRVQAIQQHAVEAGLGYLQDAAAVCRRGKGGESLESGQLVIATFEHGTSRAQDPQLHTHCLVINAARRADGSWGAIRSRDLFQHKMAAGAIYRAELAAGLQREMGLEIQRDGFSFRVQGVSEAVCRKFSTRRAQIEKALAERGLTGAVAAKVAALDTRQVKAHTARSVLFERWEQAAREMGWTTERAASLLNRHHPKPNPDQIQKTLVAQTIKELTDMNSFFAERELVRAAATNAQGQGLDAAQVLAGVREALRSPHVQDLGCWRGERRFTSQEILDQERSLLDQVAASRHQSAHAVAPAAVERIIADTLKDNPRFSTEQRSAVEQVTAKPGGIQVIEGLAGTGKSTTLNAAREVWEKNGLTVLGAAFAGKAAAGLAQNAGITSVTLAKLLHDVERPLIGLTVRQKKLFPKAPKWSPAAKATASYLAFESRLRVPVLEFRKEQIFPNASRFNPLAYLYVPKLGLREQHAPVKLTAKTILVVDEAGMVDTRTMQAVVAAVTRAKAKLVLVGDSRQLQPIQAGAPFKAIAEKLGGAQLNEIRRQTEPWAREMVKLFSEGKAGEALKLADARGLVQQAPTMEQLRGKLIGDWKGDGLTKPQENLILAANNADASALNRQAQQARQAAGKLGRSGVKINGQKIHQGDRVLFGKNARTLGIQNGSLATVAKIDRRVLQVRLDNGQRVNVSLRHYPQEKISLGYAVTTHKAQGMTVKNAFVLVDPIQQGRELTYVQASRASATTRFYVDEATAGRQLREIAEKMGRSRSKELASALRQERAKDERRQRQGELERLRREEEQRRQQQQQQRSQTYSR